MNTRPPASTAAAGALRPNWRFAVRANDPGRVTFTVTVAVAPPALLLAVIVYVVVAEGWTVRLPALTTLPSPWSSDTASAPVTLQATVLDCPGETTGGLAVNESMAGLSFVLEAPLPLSARAQATQRTPAGDFASALIVQAYKA